MISKWLSFYFIKKIVKISSILITYVLFYLVAKKTHLTEKSILLVRIDAIGDYIIFRNFIEILKKDIKYKSYKITLLGNNTWKNIAEEFDHEYIDEFIWIDKSLFFKSFFYRYKKLQEITSKGYEITISPVYSRDFLYIDNIINVIYAKEKIGYFGDLNNIKKWQKKISDTFYTQLIPSDDNLMFEFYRNKYFFEYFLQKKIKITKPTIDAKKLNLGNTFTNCYIVLFIGASVSFRKWSNEGFAKIAYYIKNEFDLDVVLCSDSSDNESAMQIESLCSKKIINFVGKTSILELLDIIYNAKLIISNETCIPHFSISLDKDILVISNGNHFGRFTPYPQDITNHYHAIYHPMIENTLDSIEKIKNKYGYGSELDINDIEPKNVINKLESILLALNTNKRKK